MNEVGHHHRQVAAHHGVDEHDHRADDHHDVVVETEQRGEQLAHGHEAAAHVHAEEHQDDHGRDGGDHALLVMETLGEEVRNGDGIAGHYRVAAQSPGHKLPVEIGAERQADGGPHRVGRAGEVGQARQAHQQPAAHVGGFGAQGREPRPHAAPARKVFLGGGVGAFGVDESDGQHGRKIDDHGQQNPEIVGQLRPLPNHDAKRLPPWQELCADMRADMRLTPERRHTDRHSREYGRNALRLMVVDTRAQAPSTVSILRRCFIRAPPT